MTLVPIGSNTYVYVSASSLDQDQLVPGGHCEDKAGWCVQFRVSKMIGFGILID